MAPNLPVITELDAARIRELGARLPVGRRAPDPLGELIAMVTSEADVVPRERVAADVVTVNSTVSFREGSGGAPHRVTVVYPQDVSIPERRISLLSPVGRALLGRRVGDFAHIAMPDGTMREIRIVEMHYQPEASGDPER